MYLRSILSFLFLLISTVPALTIKGMPAGTTTTISGIQRDSTEWISISDLAEKLGFRWQWDIYSQRLTCTKNTSTLAFTQDIQFYTHDGVVEHMAIAPVRIKAGLYLPSSLASGAFITVLPKSTRWNDLSGTLTFNTSPYSISSLICDQKQNGTLVTITLADSVPVDFTYFYPNLTLNFFGGTVDTQAIRRSKRIGVIDSVFGIQYKESAQISLILCREIEEPQVDYIEDTRTIMVSLRPKNFNKKAAVQTLKISTENESSVNTIVLDPGHGGKDPGAIGVNGVREKDVVLPIALMVREMLKKQSQLTIHMTRDKDVFIPLNERTKMANDKKADLFVSVHANAIPGPRKRQEATRGYKIYFLSQAKNEEDKMVAMRENAVIELEDKPQKYDYLQNVLIDLAGNEYLRESQDLCILFEESFNRDLKKIERLQLGVGQANFWVLNGAYMPSVLIETGFLSNPAEEKLLADKEFQKKIAIAICEAILTFKKHYETGL